MRELTGHADMGRADVSDTLRQCETGTDAVSIRPHRTRQEYPRDRLYQLPKFSGLCLHCLIGSLQDARLQLEPKKAASLTLQS